MHNLDGIGAGSFKCYGCGHKCSWNELASTLGLKKYSKAKQRADSQEVPVSNLERLDADFLPDKAAKREDVRLFELDNQAAVDAAGIKARKWRDFRLDFLAELGIKICYVRKIDLETNAVNDWGRYYMYLPISVRGKTRGYIKAQIDKPRKKGIPSYINSAGSWSLKSGLFPYDATKSLLSSRGLATVAIVEGPRDALRLIRHGIPALCIMGTHSWGKEKFRLVEFLGVERVIVMMDGDDAGKKSTRLLTTGVGPDGSQVCPPLSESFQVKIVRLWNYDTPEGESLDPGNCPIEILDKVKRLVI